MLQVDCFRQTVNDLFPAAGIHSFRLTGALNLVDPGDSRHYYAETLNKGPKRPRPDLLVVLSVPDEK